MKETALEKDLGVVQNCLCFLENITRLEKFRTRPKSHVKNRKFSAYKRRICFIEANREKSNKQKEQRKKPKIEKRAKRTEKSKNPNKKRKKGYKKVFAFRRQENWPIRTRLTGFQGVVFNYR